MTCLALGLKCGGLGASGLAKLLAARASSASRLARPSTPRPVPERARSSRREIGSIIARAPYSFGRIAFLSGSSEGVVEDWSRVTTSVPWGERVSHLAGRYEGDLESVLA